MKTKPIKLDGVKGYRKAYKIKDALKRRYVRVELVNDNGKWVYVYE